MRTSWSFWGGNRSLSDSESLATLTWLSCAIPPVTWVRACFSLGGTSNGHLVKYIEYTGQGAHAGAAPHMGINALNAANFALAAIHANRDTLREQETARIHGIITRGGEVVSAVPADVRLEWRVRSSASDDLLKKQRQS